MSTYPDYVTLGFGRIEAELPELIEAFSEALCEMGEQELASFLPWRHSSPTSLEGELPGRLGLVYSIAFQLLNILEENTAAEMRVLREQSEGPQAERGSWAEQIQRMLDAGHTAEEIRDQLGRTTVEPVLTAHPTEAKRLSVLEQHRVISRLLEKRSHAESPREKIRLQKETVSALERLWRTGEILMQKPTLTDERRNVLYYLRDVFPEVLTLLDERLKEAWESCGLDPSLLQSEDSLPQLRFGTWVGGDRDGHPFVTAEVTAETLERLRANALVVMHRRLTSLAEALPLSEWMQSATPALMEARQRAVTALGDAAKLVLESNVSEPWRQYVELLRQRLPVELEPGQIAKLRNSPGSYRHSHELHADLLALHDSLIQAGAHRLAQHDVAPVLRALKVFGFHLARLDIRQNSAFHSKAISQLMCAAGMDGGQWEEWSERERLRFLEKELNSPRPFLHGSSSAGPEADAVLSCYRALAKHMKAYGSAGLGSLIVSMTRRVSDLLVVYLLAREAGMLRLFPEGMTCLLPVVPLFETVDDLERGPDILRAFLEMPVTRRSLEYQAKLEGGLSRPRQQVMVGYSDSNKDAGIIASQWALQKAQAALARVSQEAGLNVEFFHGRGGTISRGAGPTHRFLEALPAGSLTGSMRLTEQGETIAQKYANIPTAAYNLELLLAGVGGTSLLRGKAPSEPPVLAPIMEKLSNASMMAYRALLELPGFLEFHRQATPMDALENARIGSRPTRRTGATSLADLRAIPWVFSWTQARFYLTGWFGVGSGLASLTPEEFEQVRQHVPSWMFLRYVITNVESSLASTDLEIMRQYANLVHDPALRESIWSVVEAEWHRTGEMLQRLREAKIQHLRPRFTRTLELRAEALRVLHQQQITLLERWRSFEAGGDRAGADEVLPELLLSINAIASGLRTTG